MRLQRRGELLGIYAAVSIKVEELHHLLHAFDRPEHAVGPLAEPVPDRPAEELHEDGQHGPPRVLRWDAVGVSLAVCLKHLVLLQHPGVAAHRVQRALHGLFAADGHGRVVWAQAHAGVHLEGRGRLLRGAALGDVPPGPAGGPHGVAEHGEGHGHHNHGRGVGALLLEVAVGDALCVFLVAAHGARVDDRSVALEAVAHGRGNLLCHGRLLELHTHGGEHLVGGQLVEHGRLELAHRSVDRLYHPHKLGVRLVVCGVFEDHGDLHGIHRRCRPGKVDERRNLRVHPCLDYRGVAHSMHLMDHFVIMASYNDREEAHVGHLDVFLQVLVGQGDDLVKLWVGAQQLSDHHGRSVARRYHGLCSPTEGTVAVDGLELASTDAEAGEGHLASTCHAVGAGQQARVVHGQRGLEVWHVRVQPLALELPGALDQLRVRDILLVVPEADIVNWDLVENSHHATPCIQ
mmetsp:Transcript_58777/g.189023  ORF Transcript_58777/g.189023 Transcript_58777/m.189023 type:complete len:461 (+) Transcript_58777:324-1706(+)